MKKEEAVKEIMRNARNIAARNEEVKNEDIEEEAKRTVRWYLAWCMADCIKDYSTREMAEELMTAEGIGGIDEDVEAAIDDELGGIDEDVGEGEYSDGAVEYFISGMIDFYRR